MARKNLLAGLTSPETQEGAPAAAYPVRGASKSMIRSVSELAKQADAYLDGEQVIELDPDIVDSSFVPDRIGEDQKQYHELREAIRERGQDTPVLLRPHPKVDGRYMVVFGHRRLRVARELGRKVRAVVKRVDDQSHIIAQGQENTARANLSFVEKATFAKRLQDMGYDRTVISSALSANDAAVSKMITVATRIPFSIIEQIGSAPTVGRERWVELSLLVPQKLEEAEALLRTPHFAELGSAERFSQLYSALNRKGRPVKKSAAKGASTTWHAADNRVRAQISHKGDKATIALSSADGVQFAQWIRGNLEKLYGDFRRTKE